MLHLKLWGLPSMLPCPGLPPAGPPGLGEAAAIGESGIIQQFSFLEDNEGVHVFLQGGILILGVSCSSTDFVELAGRIVGDVDGLFPWDLPLSESINRF